MTLDPRLAADLRRRYEELLATKPEHRPDQLSRYYETFRRVFGPEVLASLSGERLLLKLHERNTHDSLVYWLEFKADEEFPGRLFGSIAGGSALKFEIYSSRETGEWMTGPPLKMRRLGIAEAVAVAERQRDQLVAGCAVLEEYVGSPQSADYEAIQRRMLEVAPDVADSGWGHKYFALCYPTLLDDYHAPDYQRFHLIKILQTPAGGRYHNAEPFLRVARELEMPVTGLGSVMNGRNGSPHGYWRVGTSADDQPGRGEWPAMRDGGFAAIGWNDLGDLSDVPVTREGKERIREGLAPHWPSNPQQVGRATKQVFDFMGRIQQRDLILAADGGTVIGIGRVTGDYYFETKGPSRFAHRRPVEWLSLEEWTLPEREGLRTTCVPLRKYDENLIEVERRLLDVSESPKGRTSDATEARAPLSPLSGHAARINSILERKGQVILYGPPGTGKTYWSQKTAHELVARSWFQRSWSELSETERGELEACEALEMCCFHPAYGYEEFLEGYRPTAKDGTMVFELRDGLFKRLCDRARKDPEHRYVLMIDEINRGDVPRIFGELMTVLERSKRGVEISLPVSGRRFSVPGNVSVIATMNTADRSIALLDAALRRRFGFIELMPDYAVFEKAAVSGVP